VAFGSAGASDRPLTSLRAGVRAMLDTFDADEERKILERTRLIFTNPALRARSLQNMLTTMDVLAEALARDTGLPPTDPRVRVFTGAVVGAWIGMLVQWAETGGDEGQRLGPALDGALAALADGLDRPLAGER
jgi:hypothetical protein